MKVSNSCWKNIFFNKNEKREMYEKKLNELKIKLKSDHGLVDCQFFHLYPKKRIIIESKFSPVTDLYEFKFFILNNKIKFIYLQYYISSRRMHVIIYDPNYNFLFQNRRRRQNPLNIFDKFEKNTLEKIKQYAIKLSEDFPNFIRLDLYIFHNQIYLSELTFASYNGYLMDPKEKYVQESVANFSLIKDCL